jgi:hypothetical protein
MVCFKGPALRLCPLLLLPASLLLLRLQPSLHLQWSLSLSALPGEDALVDAKNRTEPSRHNLVYYNRCANFIHVIISSA